MAISKIFQFSPDVISVDLPDQQKNRNLRSDPSLPVTFISKGSLLVDPFGYLMSRSVVLNETFADYYEGESHKVDSLILRSKLKQFLFCLHRLVCYRKEKISHSSLWITDSWSHGYYHWLIETLSRLVRLEEYWSESVLYLPFGYDKFTYITESLKSFPVKEVRYLKERTLYSFENFIFASRTASLNHFNPNLVNDVSQHILRRLNLNSEKRTLRIYVSRKKASRRRIINEEQLLPIIDKFGFKKVYLEDLNWTDQLKLFARTDILLANHGAAIANVIFMNPESTVIELISGNVNPGLYRNLAKSTGCFYHHLGSKISSGTPPGNIQHEDIEFDVETFRKFLDGILNQ